LALSADIVVASEKSIFSCPGIKLGIIYISWFNYIGLFCSTPAVPLFENINSSKKALELLMTGESITAEYAL
jgi:enoyl-CoA hydratase/carnithine racemase